MKILSIFKYKKKSLMVICIYDNTKFSASDISDRLLWLKLIGLEELLNIINITDIELRKVE